MTDNEIIKALVLCTTRPQYDFTTCEECPYGGKCGDINSHIWKDCLDLISRRDVEIAALEIANEKMYDANKKQEAEIEKLTINMNAFGLGMKRLGEDLESMRSVANGFKSAYEREKGKSITAIQDFADRLKEHAIDIDVSFGYGREHFTEAVTLIEIDNLVKEMLGAQK